MVTALPNTSAKDLFPRGPTLFARLLFVLIISLFLLVIDHRRPEQLQPIRNVIGLGLYPLQVFADLPVTLGAWASTSVSSRQSLIQENKALKEEHLILQARLQKMAALEAENRRIRSLLKSAEVLDERVLIGEILSVDLDPYRHQVLLNKGEQHEAYDGQPLIDAYGVTGQIIDTGPISSTAMLITDANHALPVEVNRSAIRTIAQGTGKIDELVLPYLPNASDIKIGDLLVSSGLGGRFPPGYPVALVTNVEKRPGIGFAKVTAKPTARLNRTRHVLLVWREAPVALQNETANPVVDDDAAVTEDAGSDAGQSDPLTNDSDDGTDS